MSKTLNRSIQTWENSDPTGMSSMSKAAIYHALVDAKHDILLLASIVEKQTGMIKKFENQHMAHNAALTAAKGVRVEGTVMQLEVK